ncbi:MAG: PEP-CTERM sorting domain-containing protein [Aquabacterium sp.]|nr:PEP-CTERM sorting domain-containing protein [Aquabacterium sp.]
MAQKRRQCYFPGKTMKLKTLAIAAMLVMGAASASAQRLATYTDTFVYESGSLLALGFGRGGDVISEPTDPVLRFAPASFSLLSAATPGTLPFTFHDIWKFNGLAAGTYSLDTTIDAFTNTTFGLVLFVWQDNGSLNSFDFQIAPDMKSAQGSGTFTVGAGCDINYCVNVHIYGWDDGLGIPGSGYGPQTTFGVTPVPEPTTGAMLLAGLGALGWLARRRRA